jgi:hypothetical protein
MKQVFSHSMKKKAFGVLFYLHEIYANNSVNQVSSDMFGLFLKFSININKYEPEDVKRNIQMFELSKNLLYL